MKHYYLLPALATLLSFSACDSDDDEPFIMKTPPIGQTYAHGDIMSITFESADSVIFRSTYSSLYYNPRIYAKAHYTFDNGHVVIENPLGDKSWISQNPDGDKSWLSPGIRPCNMALEGTFTSPHVLKTSDFFFIAPGVQAAGCPYLTTPGYDWHGIKMYPNANHPKEPHSTLERNYHIGFFNSDLALDLNNDGIASTDLTREFSLHDNTIYDFDTPENRTSVVSNGDGTFHARFRLPIQSWTQEGNEPDVPQIIELQSTCTETDGMDITLSNSETNRRIQILHMERTGINVFRLDLRLTLYDFKTRQWATTDAWAFFYGEVI